MVILGISIEQNEMSKTPKTQNQNHDYVSFEAAGILAPNHVDEVSQCALLWR